MKTNRNLISYIGLTLFKDKGVAHVCAMFPINNIFFPSLVLGFGKKNGEVREKKVREPGFIILYVCK